LNRRLKKHQSHYFYLRHIIHESIQIYITLLLRHWLSFIFLHIPQFATMPRGGHGLLGLAVSLGTEVYQHQKEKKTSKGNAAVEGAPHNNQGPLSPWDTHSLGETRRSGSAAASHDEPSPSYNDYADTQNTHTLSSFREEDSNSFNDGEYSRTHPLPSERSSAPQNLSQNEVDQRAMFYSDEEPDDLEEEWELDEAGRNFADRASSPLLGGFDADRVQYQSESEKIRTQEALIRDLVIAAGHPPQYPPRLNYPVIIPQRRQGKEDRGFIRAYAPALNNSGIGQTTFLEFLEHWQTASKVRNPLRNKYTRFSNLISQVNPWIDVVMISTQLAGFPPSVIAMAVTTAVQIAAQAAEDAQSRARSNTYLDRVNQELFMPRGHYAAVMKFKSDFQLNQQRNLSSGITGVVGQIFFSERLDFDQATTRYSQSSPGDASRTQQLRRDLRPASGEIRSGIEMQEAAELIFPDIDAAAHRYEGTDSSGRSKAKLKSANKFVQGYLNRRAQAQYANENTGSTLATPTPQFSSRSGDPTATMQSNSGLFGRASVGGGNVSGQQHHGGLLGLVGGGAQQESGFGRGRRGGRRGGGRGHRGGGLISMGLKALSASQQRTHSPGMPFNNNVGTVAHDDDGAYNNYQHVASGGGQSAGYNDNYNASSSNQRDPSTGDTNNRTFPNLSVPYGSSLHSGRQSDGVQKVMQEDVLYLVIVNMPSGQEVQNNVNELEFAMRRSIEQGR
jgi:hypothetical protein